MRNMHLFFLFVSLITSFKLFALSQDSQTLLNESKPIFDKNYIQIDPLYLDYQFVNADNTKYNENNLQLMTSRPSILFYFNIKDYILRPFFSINPTLSNNQGSFAAGKLFDQTFEVGLYTLLNHIENDVGTGKTENAIISTQFLLGPYALLYPYVDNGSYLQIYARVAYDFRQYKTITSGSTANVTEQAGVNVNLSSQYSMKLVDKIYYSPTVAITYYLTNDYGGGNTMRTGYEFQIIPISFQMSF